MEKRNKFEMTVTLENGKQLTQVVEAFDSAEALLLFASRLTSRQFAQYSITDKDGYLPSQIRKIDCVPDLGY